MKVVVLCGGYGTRLVRDVINDPSQEFKHLVNVPKALLPVGDCSLLTHWVKIFQNIPEIEHLCIEVSEDQMKLCEISYKVFLCGYVLRIL